MRDELSIVKQLLPLLKLRRGTLPTIILLGLLASAFEGISLYLFLPLLALLGGDARGNNGIPPHLATMIDVIPTAWQVPALVGLVMVTVLLKSAISYANAAFFAAADAEAGHIIRQRLYSRILSASFGYLDTQPSGRIANALFSETWRSTKALSVLFGIIVNASAVVILTGILLYTSWRTTLLVAPFVVAIVVILNFITRKAKAFGEAAVAANSTFAKRAWEGLAGLRTIQTFGQASYEEERFAHASERVRRQFLDLELLSSLSQPTFEVLIALAIGLWIVAMYWSGTGVPTLAVFLLVLYRLQPRVGALASARVALLELGGAVLEVEAVKRGCEQSRLKSGDRSFTMLRDRITLENVTAQYDVNGAPSLQSIDLSIPGHLVTAIVGPSGAGKTTLINLLCRHMDPTAGVIRVDGVPLPQLRLDDWRNRVAVVTQDIHLFSATVADNISYGRLDATRDQIIEAARLANAHSFISELPQGYDTEVGERGVRLSGGQRQRIAFARAIIRGPEILILDEATNALDSYAESLIQKALVTLKDKVTIVIVAHRLITIRNADHIVVIDNGRVVQAGDYSSLMAAEGLFAAMVRLQAAEPRSRVLND